MNRRSAARQLLALTVVVTMALVGVAGVASAKGRHHHQGGGSGSGSAGSGGGNPPLMIVTVSPDPLVETGQSNATAVVQVETNPSLAGESVDISSSQLEASCQGAAEFTSFQANMPETATLDNDGNATFLLVGFYCAPGSNVIEASLTQAPYYTALTTLQINPPTVTAPGVTGFPNPEVEIGDASGFAAQSTVFGVFYVETDPVYSGQTVEIDSSQLDASCGQFWAWGSFNAGGTAVSGIGPDHLVPGEATTLLDDDGNAAFFFEGESCAAGTWDVIADVNAGTHPTYVTTFTVLPPTPTI
jgi:hypothetical protein